MSKPMIVRGHSLPRAFAARSTAFEWRAFASFHAEA
jgi:hypothetical protein